MLLVLGGSPHGGTREVEEERKRVERREEEKRANEKRGVARRDEMIEGP
jgi:hypothetical protein